MFRCLLWGTGKEFIESFNLVKYYELMGIIKGCSITGNETCEEYYGYDFILKSDIRKEDYDIVIVFSKKIRDIEKEAFSMGFSGEEIIPSVVLKIPQLDIKAYMEIKKNPPSIFSMNCWGGIVYHRLGLEFKSPFINMFVLEDDFIRFLSNPKKYIACEIDYIEEKYNEDLKIYYPICACDDIFLYFNHYNSFEDARNCWNRRKLRINWNNLFVAMYTENDNIAKEFSCLSYDRKVCFTSFETDYKSCIYLKNENNYFYKTVSATAWGKYSEIDIIKLLSAK